MGLQIQCAKFNEQNTQNRQAVSLVYSMTTNKTLREN